MRRIQNDAPNPVRVAQNVTVPESQNVKTLLRQPCVTNRIITVLRVLAAISFDNQPRPETHEIHDVFAKLLLPFELKSAEASGAEYRPKLCFCLGRFTTHPLGERQEIASAPSPSHRCAAGPFLSRKGRGGLLAQDHTTSPIGFSTSCLIASISCAPSAPSMARWSKLPEAWSTVATSIAPFTT